jgi:hypothetical protein
VRTLDAIRRPEAEQTVPATEIEEVLDVVGHGRAKFHFASPLRLIESICIETPERIYGDVVSESKKRR